MEETLEAYAHLVKQGKVRFIGASNFTAARIEESLLISQDKKWPSYQCLQPLYNLYDRADFENNLSPLCLEENIAVIPFYSLAAGFLTGKYRSEADLGKSPRGGGIKKYLNDRGFRILKALDEVSKELHATPAQVSMAWLIAQPAVTAPIASATSLEQFKDLLAGTRLELGMAVEQMLDQASQ
jgi:aryl-alcohol dehydrogenase-like predicted oxidoreductase